MPYTDFLLGMIVLFISLLSCVLYFLSNFIYIPVQASLKICCACKCRPELNVPADKCRIYQMVRCNFGVKYWGTLYCI